MVAGNTTLGAVMPLYVILSYASIDLQKGVRDLGGIRQLLASQPQWGPVYDVAEASVLGTVTILLGAALFLLMSRQLSRPRLRRGVVAGLPVLVIGSALGRYLHNPADPMPGLIAVIVTILASMAIAMWAATRFRPGAE